MSDYHISAVPVSDDPALAPLWEQIATIQELNDLAVHGHTDLCDPADVLRKSYLMQVDNKKVTVVVGERADGPVVGYGGASLPIRDNLELAYVGANVHPDHQHRGLGSRLLAEAERIATADGRTKLMAWTAHRDEAGEDEADALLAPTGVGKLSATDGLVRFAAGHGYALEQTERHSQMPLPVPGDVITPLREQAQAASAGYRVVTWTGVTPDEYVDSMVGLHTRMSTDVPMGGLEFEEERWDAERVLRLDRNETELGYLPYQASAQHVESGELVAYTRLLATDAKPEIAYQDDTLVVSAHRGHRLGMLVKVANADALSADRPQIRRVHTWNAGENQWMLAINVAMGFRRASTEGAWQKKLG